MLFDPERIKVFYVACGYTDMRKQIDGLAAVVDLSRKRDTQRMIEEDR